MMLDASAILAILLRAPGADALLARLDAHDGPFLATPVALLDAVAGLAAVRAGTNPPSPHLLGQARDAIAEFAAALALREVPVSADLGRRAADLLAAEGGAPGRALSAAAARAYRVDLLAWDGWTARTGAGRARLGAPVGGQP